jgi:hypothetical protein
VSFFAKPASAVPPFQKQFYDQYLEGNANAEFVAEVKKAKCNLCHVGKKKTDRNAYAKELSKLLDKKKDAKDPAAIKAAMDKVAEMKTGETTYGELIKKGDLAALTKE